MRKDYQKPDIKIVRLNQQLLQTNSITLVSPTPTNTVETPAEILSRPSFDFFDGMDDGTAIQQLNP